MVIEIRTQRTAAVPTYNLVSTMEGMSAQASPSQTLQTTAPVANKDGAKHHHLLGVLWLDEDQV